MLDSVHESCYYLGTANETAGFKLNTLTGGERTMNETTAREFARLAEWLRANGMTDAQIIDCLKYIAGTTPPTNTAGK